MCGVYTFTSFVIVPKRHALNSQSSAAVVPIEISSVDYRNRLRMVLTKLRDRFHDYSHKRDDLTDQSAKEVEESSEWQVPARQPAR